MSIAETNRCCTCSDARATAVYEAGQRCACRDRESSCAVPPLLLLSPCRRFPPAVSVQGCHGYRITRHPRGVRRTIDVGSGKQAQQVQLLVDCGSAVRW